MSLSAFSELLEAAKEGDGWAFDQLFRSWNGPVTGFVRARGVTDFDGVVDDVFLRAFNAIGRFQGDEAAFRAWLFTIARNRVIDEARRTQRAPATTQLESVTPLPAPDDVAADVERRFGHDRVMALLGTLTDEQREVLTLRFVADLTIDQIAHVTGRRRGAVKQLQRRALRRLERELEGNR